MKATVSQVSLKKKLYYLISLPLITLVVVCGYLIYQSKQQLSRTEKSLEETQISKKLTYFIENIQIERGKSVSYISGSSTLDDLNTFRKKTDERQVVFLNHFNKFKYSEEIRTRILKIFDNVVEARRTVNDSKDKKVAILNYSRIVNEAIWAEIATAQDVEDLDNLLRISIWESIRENSGLLRANITGILSLNEPMSDLEVSKLINLRAGVNIGFTSPALLSTNESSKKIEELQKNSEWNTSFEAINVVINKYNVGNYGLDPNVFFDMITKSISKIGNNIELEYEASEKHSFETMKDQKLIFNITLGLIIFLTIAITYFSIRIIQSATNEILNISKNIDQVSQELSSASFSLSSASQEVSASTTEAAASLEETVASMEEISSMIQQNAKNAVYAAELSYQSEKMVQDGDAEMSLLLSNMSKLSASSKQIEEIINVIDDIAFQTNLLALNAAVEAARAGEQGKGFAVVAEAVRALAQRSSLAAKEIGGLIRQSVSEIDAGEKIATKSGESFKNILNSIVSVSKINHEISVASKEQSDGIAQIGSAMNQLDVATQQNASSGEDIAGASQNLSANALTLSDLLIQMDRLIRGA